MKESRYLILLRVPDTHLQQVSGQGHTIVVINRDPKVYGVICTGPMTRLPDPVFDEDGYIMFVDSKPFYTIKDYKRFVRFIEKSDTPVIRNKSEFDAFMRDFTNYCQQEKGE